MQSGPVNKKKPDLHCKQLKQDKQTLGLLCIRITGDRQYFRIQSK